MGIIGSQSQTFQHLIIGSESKSRLCRVADFHIFQIDIHFRMFFTLFCRHYPMTAQVYYGFGRTYSVRFKITF